MKKETKQKIFDVLTIAFLLGIVIILMASYYDAGREKGRKETVQMISELADEYEFRIWDNEGWALGASNGALNYDGSLKTLIKYSYDWDDNKIILSYENNK